jgi:colanic acid/amylovoran biosynthesis glycosyltransferase
VKDVVGHFVITYLRSSWLHNQITSLTRYQSRLYSWVRTVNDDVTDGDAYFQAGPELGNSKVGRRVTLGIARGREFLNHQTSKKLAARMNADQAQVIHAHFGRAGYLGLPMARQAKLPIVTSFYGYDVSQYGVLPKWQRNYRVLFEQGDLFLCLGAQMQKNLIALGCPPEKTRIHHLGVDISGIAFKPKAWDGNRPLRVLIAAAFRPKKGIPYAIEALGKLKRDTNIDLEVTIIGDVLDTSDSPPEKQRILKAIEVNGLQNCTTLLGMRPYSYLLEQAYLHDIFLSPSITADDGDMEGTPMVLADMAATGIPIISSQHSDIPELILDGETGLLANEKDVDGLTTRLRWLADNTDQWEAMSRRAREHIEREFDTHTQATRLEAIYDSLR